MPDVPDHTMELKESETDTDAYKAQLLQQKATRVESAKALVSRANGDCKVVKKTQVKSARGRGRGRGRGKAPKEISDDQPQEVAVCDDNADHDGVPTIDVSHPGGTIDGEKGEGDGEKGEGDGEKEEGDGEKEEGGDGKKRYKRKVFTADELDAMWKQRVPCPNLVTLFFSTILHFKQECLPIHAHSTSPGHFNTHYQDLRLRSSRRRASAFQPTLTTRRANPSPCSPRQLWGIVDHWVFCPLH